ncbi:hypothetical protein [Microbulbifer thermotolerans]|uniref:Uncharacterized protein n=1 Tax=Microbulbifer thermotolerans TaxID=252514 RepID=A0A143HIA8_MICTH|nr:hypothetical protein [Microbulbifer thermotolerans]AMX01210.1 hypothetical protein A3224_00195 [Microbulbifer thermotolerans]SFC20380.1 hypothetical protein SAMN05660479_01368 [Microbulbifer thermotolerans]
MKKLYPLLAFLLVVSIAALYGLDYYRNLREQQREQTAHLLASCVNQGLLALFRLQANDWRAQPDFHSEQKRKLKEVEAQLPQQLLEGQPFAEWQEATVICDKLTRHSNLQHETIFRPLGDFAAPKMSDSRTLKDRNALKHRLRVIDQLKISAQAADRYLQDLLADIDNQLRNSNLSPQSRERALREINSQVLDFYRKGKFSKTQVDAHLQRVGRFYRLLADNPDGYSLRGGSLYFYDRNLRREIDNLNSAILQGEAQFYGNWAQIVERQQLQYK